jgi:hypothetical protein
LYNRWDQFLTPYKTYTINYYVHKIKQSWIMSSSPSRPLHNDALNYNLPIECWET